MGRPRSPPDAWRLLPSAAQGSFVEKHPTDAVAALSHRPEPLSAPSAERAHGARERMSDMLGIVALLRRFEAKKQARQEEKGSSDAARKSSQPTLGEKPPQNARRHDTSNEQRTEDTRLWTCPSPTEWRRRRFSPPARCVAVTRPGGPGDLGDGPWCRTVAEKLPKGCRKVVQGAELRTKVGRNWPLWATLGPALANFMPYSTNIGRNQPNFG